MGTASKYPARRRIWLGREREMAELAGGLDELVAGRGALYLVTGEPGIGKTRLADEVATAATARGIAVHWGRAWESGGAPSYWPFIQALRSMCRGLDAATVASLVGAHGPALAELLPELRQWIPGLAFAPAHATTERFRLFDAVGTFLHAVAARTPQLVVLDDLHAADPTSLSLLHFLVRNLRSAALVIVGTYRDAEARLSPEIGRTLTQIAREATLLPLRRLDRGEVTDFVAQATGAPPRAERVDALLRQTEGNPLFLRELLRLDHAGASQPEGIREVLRARLALLGEPARRVLEAAAVLGREFALDPLSVVAEVPRAELSTLLAPAMDAAIVEPLEQSGQWRFTHVLLREGLYGDLAPSRRAALHHAAAVELERRLGGPAVAELAHHLLNAIPAVSVAAAIDAAVVAADRAMELLAFEDASALLVRALDLVDGSADDAVRRYEVTLRLGLSRIRLGEVQRGKETCHAAAALARQLGDGERFARAVLASAYEFAPGIHDRALIELLEEALQKLPPGDGAWRARCLAQLAAERQPEPDTRALVDLARQAVAMARRLGDVETLRLTLTSAGMAMLVCADPEERAAINQEVLRLSLAAGDQRVAARAHLFLANDFFELGDRAGSQAQVHGLEQLLDELPHAPSTWLPRAFVAMNALWEGRLDEAARIFAECERLARAEEARGATLAAVPLALYRTAERSDDLPALEARLRASFAALGHELGSCVGEMMIAQLYGRAGDAERARRQLDAVRAQPVFARITEPSWLALLVDAVHLVGDIELAARLYPVLLPCAHRFFNLGPLGPFCEPPYRRQLGLLAQTLGRIDDAIEHLAATEASVERVGMRSQLARVRYELAGALLARGADADRTRAAALLESARALAVELGQSALVPLLTERLAAVGKTVAPPRAPSPEEPPCVLRREGEYWAIVAGEQTLRLRDSRGLQLLARLLESPGQEFHVLQLVGGDDEARDGGDAGALLDDEAVQSYRQRLLELREELDEAEARADSGRAERAREEIDFLTRELARAVGLGGRERRAGNAAERARTTVQKRLRNAVERIEAGLPDLGRHFDQTIRTGIFCGYLPRGRFAK